MHLWIDNILACPIDGHAPLNARLFNDEQDGILHCDQCDGAFAVIRGVPHLVRAPLRELDEERRMLERSPRDFAPTEWIASLYSAWQEAERTRTPDHLRLIEEGRYWSEFFRTYIERNSLTILDARHKGTHLPYLPYGVLAVDDRDRYRLHDHWPNPLGRRIVRFFEQTRASGARRYLDFGCGGGQFGLEACYHGGQSVGFDLAAGTLEMGRRYARERGLDAFYVRAEPSALPFQPNAFDAMVAKDALHHLYDPVAGLRAARQVLKPRADVMLIEHVAEKPRWEKLRQKIIELCSKKIRETYEGIDEPEIFQKLSPCEFAGDHNLEEILREEIRIQERRGELLFADEIALPIYFITHRKKFPAEALGKILYAAEKISLLWGRPRFVFVRGKMK